MKTWTPVIVAIVLAIALAYYMANPISDTSTLTGDSGTDNGTDGFPGNMTISDSGLALIKQFEGTRTDASGNFIAYQDATGTWTIGYGHTAGVQPGQVINADQANAYLQTDVQTAVAAVHSSVKTAVSQNQFDALVSFVFNVGAGNFASSTLLSMLNAGNASGAAAQFGAWIYSKGQQLSALVTRRAAESALFAGLGL